MLDRHFGGGVKWPTDYRLRKITYDGLFKIEHDHDVWNLKNDNRVEIVNQPRRGNIVTLEDTGSAWGKFFGGKH